MPMQRVTMTSELRQLIRITRTDRAGISQRDAAARAGGLSEVWWRQIEGNRTRVATADTLARMCYAIDVTPAQLRAIGHEHVAELVEQRRNLLEPESRQEHGELGAYLMAAPGLTDEERAALVVVANVFKGQNR